MWGQIVGSLIGAGASIWGAKSQNKANRQEAAESQAFQERMSNTSYQRSMDDMRKAGLNPILAYQKGGASTPAGVTPQITNEMAGAASSAKDLAMQVAQIKNIDEQNKNLIADRGKTHADTDLSRAVATTNHQLQSKYLQEIKILKENVSSAKASATTAKIEDAFFKKYPWLRNIDLIGRAVNPFSSAAGRASNIGSTIRNKKAQ